MEIGFVKKSVIVKTDINDVWNYVSKITSLNWLEGQKSTKLLSQKKRGVSTARLISFEDGSTVKEYIVGWHPKKYFSYIATSGLPLNSYHATISMNRIENGVKITWESYFSSNEEKSDFNAFTKFLSQFYVSSLKNLKVELEK
jgi:hypothetical protein